MRLHFIRTFFVAFVLSLGTTAFASVSSGTIDASNKTAKVCHSVGCVTPTPGVINFKPTGSTAVTIDDTTGINGIAWGNELGWINLNPTGSEGLTINSTTGVISGKAWSQVAGWVNFAPTGQSVSINSNGEFTGWAWAGGPYGGWIKFNCADTGACVKTDWRPLGNRGGGNGPIVGGGGGGGGGPSDMCFNISGVQYSVPVGYTQSGTNCSIMTVTGADVCPNIVGAQTTLPVGMTLDQGGLCIGAFEDIDHDGIPNTSDPDIDGDGVPNTSETGDADQDGVPDAYESNTRDTDGDGIVDNKDPQDDAEGAVTANEQLPIPVNAMVDTDGDGIPNYLDPITNTTPGAGGGDSDGDGRSDMQECPSGFACPDTDADGVPDYNDRPSQVSPTVDSDGDGVPDQQEVGDSDNDGVPNALEPNNVDTDGDGIPNQQDSDDDGDGYPTITERTATTDILHTDQDNDGILAYLDAIDNRKVQQQADETDEPQPKPKPKPKSEEPLPVIDVVPELPERESPTTVPTPDYVVEPVDSVIDGDADGIPDSIDPVVASGTTSFGGDSDGDGIPDEKECTGGYPCPDEDTDGIPNYMDPDDDDDGIASIEDADGDNDGIADAEDFTPHGDRTEQHQSGLTLARTEPIADNAITFSFVPTAVQVNIQSPALVKIVRTLAVIPGVSEFIHDPDPTGDPAAASVEVVGLVLLAAAAAAIPTGLGYAALAFAALFLVRKWGMVYDAQTGQALANARVMLYDEKGMLISETTSDARGDYSFKVPSGKYQLRVAMPSYSQASQSGVQGIYDGGVVTIGVSGKVTAHIPMKKTA
jgi:hypothetical protein